MPSGRLLSGRQQQPRGTCRPSRSPAPRLCGPFPRLRSGRRALAARRGGGGDFFCFLFLVVRGEEMVLLKRSKKKRKSQRRRNQRISPNSYVLFWTAESCASSGSAERAAATAAATPPAAEAEVVVGRGRTLVEASSGIVDFCCYCPLVSSPSPTAFVSSAAAAAADVSTSPRITTRACKNRARKEKP